MTKYLLDRDVVSAVENPAGHRNVRRWAESVSDDALFISVVTVMEARKGFARLRARTRAHHRAAGFEADFENLLVAFADRVLSIDRPVADLWGVMLAARDANVMDTAIAATAVVHGCVVATRNLRHFRQRGVRLIDPFRTDPTIEEP